MSLLHRPAGEWPVSLLKPGVTFETKCYEQDWRELLLTDRLSRAIGLHRYSFAERVLYINNVEQPDTVCRHAQRLVDEGVLTSYVVVDDYSEEALRFFGLKREDFQGGYYYSIAELVSIYLCRTDYLLHYAGDCMLEEPVEWVEPALKRMRLQPSIVCANPVPNGWHEAARREAMVTHGDFHLGYGFSDQCYLIRTLDFKARIYNEKHSDSERYPAYGGELFEKRVDAWMRSSGLLRLTWRHGCYWHRGIRSSTAELGSQERKETANVSSFSPDNASAGGGAAIYETSPGQIVHELAEPALACYRAGVKAMEEQEYETAIVWLQLADSARAREQQAGKEPDSSLKWLPLLQLAVCYDRLGQTEKAWLSNEAASVYAPDGQPSIAANRIYLRGLLDACEEERNAVRSEAAGNTAAGAAAGDEGLLLSVLIPSLPERSASLAAVLEELQAQLLGQPVELLVLSDNRKRTTGAKRNSLLQQAKGRFVVFADDDDRLSHDYVAKLVEAIRREPDSDCIVFDVMVYSGGQPFRLCKYGTEYEYGMDYNYYYRKPNHLMAYRKEIALKHPFADLSYGEDDEWAARASAEVKRQVRIDAVLYHYDWAIKPQSWYAES
ncbi:glycosyltransferase family 2 protein [Paenibacillus pasadenensis]|uniref:glycosyltransferase family 2 protein n=1 Tax=Paenibacillus pasadenensis TaxID=217090 RepID=UPI00203AA141|nr:glycosyltransferase family A protein [Paenibacillus pasadenensis]MCM3750332.1 glycosyltransferase family 2 protein [Paenibacillus pasadenensis]